MGFLLPPQWALWLSLVITHGARPRMGSITSVCASYSTGPTIQSASSNQRGHDMLTVKVDLNSAITGKTTEIAKVRIWNEGRSPYQLGTKTDYGCLSTPGLDEGLSDYPAWRTPRKSGKVTRYDREKHNVLHLVSLALRAMGFGLGGDFPEVELFVEVPATDTIDLKGTKSIKDPNHSARKRVPAAKKQKPRAKSKRVKAH